MTADIILLALDTRNFTFAGAGTTNAEALDALWTGIHAHLAEYPQAELSYFTDLLAERHTAAAPAHEGLPTECRRIVVTPGASYRDDERIR